MKYVNVYDPNGYSRIAGINEMGNWETVSAGIAVLEGRETSANRFGTQCNGHWLGGASLTGHDGTVYPSSAD